jgi:hypothetical protein
VADVPRTEELAPRLHSRKDLLVNVERKRRVVPKSLTGSVTKCDPAQQRASYLLELYSSTGRRRLATVGNIVEANVGVEAQRDGAAC